MATQKKILVDGLLWALACGFLATAVPAPPFALGIHERPRTGVDRGVRDQGRQVPAPSGDDWFPPVSGDVTSGFGERWGTVHEGVDIANEIGTPVRAGSAGTVVDSGPASGYGMWIRIQHPNDTVSIYGHIDQAFVVPGQPVRGGQRIATVGDRGESTGPHLHFQLEIAGQPVDPVGFYRAEAAPLVS